MWVDSETRPRGGPLRWTVSHDHGIQARECRGGQGSVSGSCGRAPEVGAGERLMSPHCQSPVWLQEAPEAGTSSGRALEPLASRGASGRGPRQLDLGWLGIARS